MLRIATKVEGSPGKSPTVLFGISDSAKAADR